MKVVLLFPGISGIGFNSYDKDSWINHGLCSISAYAKNEGYSVELIDLRCLKSWEHFRRIIAEKEPDVVGITMMSVDYNPAMESIKIIKEVSPKTITVVGGPHPTIMPEEVENEKDIDYIVKGEGEISFVELLRNIKKSNSPQRIIQGIVPEDLDKLPFTDRGLFRDLEHSLSFKEFEGPFVTIIAGRGCRYNCSFCQPAERLIFGKKVRRRSPLNVIQELIILREKYNFKSLMLHDDCITEDRQWVVDFCELYKKNCFEQPFACQSRADIVCRNEDMVKLMVEVGLKIMIIGFESGNQRVLGFLRKGTKVEHNYEAAKICRKYGIKIWANYMLGIPTETKEEVMDTVRMIQTIKPDIYSPAFYTPHPGSDLFKYCQEQGISLIKNHDGYRRNATEAKIKGVDYKFLNQALMESRSANIPIMRNNLFRLIGSNFLPFLLRHQRLKNMAKKIFIILGLIKK